jgi:hypothetical protein
MFGSLFEAAASDRASSADVASGTRSVSTGSPRVSVPVLSIASTLTFSARSSASAFLTRMPAEAPCPVATMIAVGVASPRAQGQAITSTATALTSAALKTPPRQPPGEQGA